MHPPCRQAEIIQNPAAYVELDGQLVQALVDQKAAGKSLLLITNSDLEVRAGSAVVPLSQGPAAALHQTGHCLTERLCPPCPLLGSCSTRSA